MKFKSTLNVFMIAFIVFGTVSCGKKEENIVSKVVQTDRISTYNFDDKKQLFEFKGLKLDEDHPNLLNPQISKTNISLVKEAWIDLHQKIGESMDEKDFQWQVADSSITIVHKFYFNPEGKIEHYFFNVLNENVSMEKKEQFAKLVAGFAVNNRIIYQSDTKFAQCGKTKYINY